MISVRRVPVRSTHILCFVFLGFSLVLSACGGGGGGDDDGGSNSDPSFTSATTASTPGDTTATGYTATADDPDAGDTPTFSISGGADAGQFSIDPDSGELTFDAPPDFDNPSDSDTNNDYVVELQVTDGNGGTDVLTVTITVTGVAANADLGDLSLSTGSLDQVFQSGQTSYTAEVGFLTASLEVIATADDADATIRIDGTTVASGTPHRVELAEGSNAIAIEVTAEDDTTTRTYDLEITRRAAAQFAQQAYIKASNTGGGDEFGVSVALDGDTPAVGARGEASDGTAESDDSALDSGAVYVFTRDDAGIWSQQDYLKASNAEENDEFGVSVALDDDTLVVGAVGEASNATDVSSGDDTAEGNNSAPRSGAVYVFTRDETTSSWSQQAYVKASNTDADDFFGESVALAGDTLAVGAIGEDSDFTGVSSNGEGENDDSASGSSSGAVYVFTRDSADVWSQEAYVKASNTGGGDDFGASVALDGDTLAVGAKGEESDGTGESNNQKANSGAVYVFTRDSADTWSQQAYVKASNPDMNDDFGERVALDGDTLAVGAKGEASDGTGESNNDEDNSGAVYVFTRDSAEAWSQQAYVKASNTQGTDFFGASVALAGDTLAVGAVNEDSNFTGVSSNGEGEDNEDAPSSGAVYVFTRDGTGAWSQQAYVKASNTEGGDDFGASVALTGDTLAVGASNEDSDFMGVSIDGEGEEGSDNAFGSGAVYVRR